MLASTDIGSKDQTPKTIRWSGTRAQSPANLSSTPDLSSTTYPHTHNHQEYVSVAFPPTASGSSRRAAPRMGVAVELGAVQTARVRAGQAARIGRGRRSPGGCRARPGLASCAGEGLFRTFKCAESGSGRFQTQLRPPSRARSNTRRTVGFPTRRGDGRGRGSRAASGASGDGRRRVAGRRATRSRRRYRL